MIRIAGGYRFDVMNGQLQKTWLSWDRPQNKIALFL
jgi:hypothetical protein